MCCVAMARVANLFLFVFAITFLRGFPVDRCLVVYFDSARTRQRGDDCC